MARNLPSSSFNRVVGIRKGQADQVRQLVEWYRERGAEGRFEIAAGDYDPALGRELTRLGFFQSGFHAALIGEPELRASAPSDISVEPVMSGADMEEFLEAYVRGWGIPDAAREPFKANVRSWSGESGWSLYVARVDGKPAAAAILFVHAGVGYFADAATDPAFRRPRTSCGIVISTPARRQRGGRRLRLQRCGFSIDQPPQYGAGRDATSLPSGHLDAVGVSQASQTHDPPAGSRRTAADTGSQSICMTRWPHAQWPSDGAALLVRLNRS